MVYIRRKVKTRRRVKRTKTKNTRKQRRLRNRTFRKSRHVNRGGSRKRSRGTMENNWQTDTRTEKEKSEQNAMENKKDKQNELRRIANVTDKLYLAPLGKGVSVNQTKKLKLTEDQLRLMDDIDAEEVPGSTEEGIWFGGKKKRTMKK